MNLEAVQRMAEQGRLYPSVIVHGGDDGARRAAAVDLARRLLCDTPENDPQAACRHCRRITLDDDGFHPDVHRLDRDLRTVTSVDATQQFLLEAQVAPFEARGQVFVITAADTLSQEAANALLKTLEEPHLTAPRHFFLLTPSQLDLLPTLRSRSMSLFLGAGSRPAGEAFDAASVGFATALAAFADSGASSDLLRAAGRLLEAADWRDPRASGPWTSAAAIVRRAADDPPPGVSRRRLLDLAGDLLEEPRLRLRGISAQRILEGAIVGRLGAA